MSDIPSEIDAFFAGATTTDFIIMAVLLLVFYKFLKKLFFIAILIGLVYFGYDYMNK